MLFVCRHLIEMKFWRFLWNAAALQSKAARWALLLSSLRWVIVQLVHARIAALELAQFPIPDVDSLLTTPPEVLDVQAESRRLLTLLSPNVRELIYRVSLVTIFLDRSRIMSIAAARPPISEPGNALDVLIGPWLERVEPDIYRLSPLLRSAGEFANGAEWTIATRQSLARALLGRRTLTPSDVS